MLIYHPAFDAYHCAFRMLTVTAHNRVMEFPKLRILDYFLCFPAEVANVQLPQEHLEVKRIARAAKNPYRGPISGARTFRDLEPIQFAAARLLALTGAFSPTELEDGTVVRTGQVLPESLSKAVAAGESIDGPVVEYIMMKMAQIPLLGLGGLKHRTGLMEYRYDAS